MRLTANRIGKSTSVCVVLSTMMMTDMTSNIFPCTAFNLNHRRVRSARTPRANQPRKDAANALKNANLSNPEPIAYAYNHPVYDRVIKIEEHETAQSILAARYPIGGISGRRERAQSRDLNDIDMSLKSVESEAPTVNQAANEEPAAAGTRISDTEPETPDAEASPNGSDETDSEYYDTAMNHDDFPISVVVHENPQSAGGSSEASKSRSSERTIEATHPGLPDVVIDTSLTAMVVSKKMVRDGRPSLGSSDNSAVRISSQDNDHGYNKRDSVHDYEKWQDDNVKSHQTKKTRPRQKIVIVEKDGEERIVSSVADDDCCIKCLTNRCCDCLCTGFACCLVNWEHCTASGRGEVMKKLLPVMMLLVCVLVIVGQGEGWW